MSPKNYENPLKTVARENFPLISLTIKKALDKIKVKKQGIPVPSFIKIA